MGLTGVPPAGARRNDPWRTTVPGQQLGRRQRLLRAADFSEVFRRGARRAGRFLVMWILPVEGANIRVGVVASKRTFPRSVDRSRVKRMLREAFRKSRDRLKPGVDVVLVGRRASLNVTTPQVESDLMAVAERIHVVTTKREPQA